MRTATPPTTLPLVNWGRLQGALAALDVDLVVATTNVNVTYLSDFWSLSQWSRRTAQIFGIAGRTPERDVDVILSLGAADLLALPGRAEPTRIWTYGDFYCAGLDGDGLPAEELAFRDAFVSASRHKRPVDALVAAVQSRGAAHSRIAVEAGGLAEGAWNAIAELLPEATLLPAEALFQNVRALKSRREIDLLRRAAQVTEEAIWVACAEVRVGSTEREVERVFHRALIDRGGLPFLTSVSGGRRTALPNAQASEYELRDGDLVRFDGGGRSDLYASDIGRMAVLGSTTDKQRRYYAAVRDGIERAVDKVRPGVTCGELFETAVATVRAAGIRHYERSHCGHGIGIENYDAPHITPRSTEVLEAGMVICVETPYYELGWGGVQAEDTLVVTESGCERFTTQPSGLIACG